MITIVAGTNRPDSMSELISQNLFELIGKYTDEEVNLIKLSELDPGILHPMMYNPEFQHPELKEMQDKTLIPADKWILVTPEYNGSYSGMVKLFIDALSIREKGATFGGKKLGLVGVAAGRAGNLRGMDHLTTSMNYMGMVVYPNRLPLSVISTLVEDGKLKEGTVELLNSFLEGFVSF